MAVSPVTPDWPPNCLIVSPSGAPGEGGVCRRCRCRGCGVGVLWWWRGGVCGVCVPPGAPSPSVPLPQGRRGRLQAIVVWCVVCVWGGGVSPWLLRGSFPSLFLSSLACELLGPWNSGGTPRSAVVWLFSGQRCSWLLLPDIAPPKNSAAGGAILASGALFG